MPDNNSEQIDFYFDYISHNAYLAWHVLPGLAEKYGCDLRAVPVLFAGFLKAFGQLGPAEVGPKLDWMNRNNLRKARLLGIPLRAPTLHPFNPLLLLRLSAQDMAQAQRSRLTGTLLRAVWVDGLDPNDSDALATRLTADGFDANALIGGASSDAAKAQLRANTEDAIARGGFGVPTMMLGTKVFWGYDDLPYLELALAGKDPLDKTDLERFLGDWEAARSHGEHRGR